MGVSSADPPEPGPEPGESSPLSTSSCLTVSSLISCVSTWPAFTEEQGHLAVTQGDMEELFREKR